MLNPMTIIHDVQDLTTPKQMYLAVLTAIVVAISMSMGDPWYGVMCAGTGAMCVVLVAEGKISNFFWGLINVGAYGYISFTNNIQGDMLLNWLVYIPFQFYGLYVWSKNQAGSGNVVTRAMTGVQLLVTVVLTILAVALTKVGLDLIGSSKTTIDAVNVVLSLVAVLLMSQRFREQWVCWIIVNITGIIMWTMIALDPAGHAGISGLVMWSAFLVNSCYGFYNWTKLSKK